MELEHMIGFSTVRGGLAHDAANPSKFIHACGASLVIGHFHDPHNQTFLLGHDQYIECFTSSRSAKLMATGQGGKNSDVCLWEYLEESETYKLRHRFYMHGEDTKILTLAFSDDERVLYSVGEDSTFFVWDVNTGNYITFDKSPVYAKATCLSSGGYFRAETERAEMREMRVWLPARTLGGCGEEGRGEHSRARELCNSAPLPCPPLSPARVLDNRRRAHARRRAPDLDCYARLPRLIQFDATNQAASGPTSRE